VRTFTRFVLVWLLMLAPAAAAAQVAFAPAAARAARSDTTRVPGRSIFAQHDSVYPRWQEETGHFLDRAFAATGMMIPASALAIASALGHENDDNTMALLPVTAVWISMVGAGAALPRGHSECRYARRAVLSTLGTAVGYTLGTFARHRDDHTNLGVFYLSTVAGAALAHPRCGGRY
jgi:hypothetical protein